MTTIVPATASLQRAVQDAFAGITKRLQGFKPEPGPREVGTIASVFTGIARVHGLPGVGFEELLQFPGGPSGIAFNLDEDGVDVVLLGDHTLLQAGQEVERTGRVMDVANNMAGRTCSRIVDRRCALRRCGSGSPLSGRYRPLAITVVPGGRRGA